MSAPLSGPPTTLPPSQSRTLTLWHRHAMWIGWCLLGAAVVLMAVGVYLTKTSQGMAGNATAFDFQNSSLLLAAIAICSIASALTVRIIRRLTEVIAIFTQDIPPPQAAQVQGRHQRGPGFRRKSPPSSSVTELYREAR